MTQASTDISSADDADLFRLDVGDLVNLKGKLESVRYGTGPRSGRALTPTARTISAPGQPSLVVTFADWSMLSVSICDEATARSIRIPLSTYVCVKARIINEDNELEALAIWELGSNPVPIPLSSGSLTIIDEASTITPEQFDAVITQQRTTVSEP